MNDWKRGIRKGIPIALGYLSVSFTFGVKAVNGGIPAWAVVLISLTNLTSAGQFAGTTLIIAGSSFVEIALTTFVINIRYMLMSLALSQKLQKGTSRRQCCLFGFGITDEVFAMASGETGKTSASYMYGLIALPIVGWTAGTALGALASDLMPSSLASAMELGLYAMFIAIIIPPAKKSLAVAFVIALATGISCALYYIPVFSCISSGFQVIIATVLAAACGAVLYPVDPGERVKNK